jgi:transposase
VTEELAAAGILPHLAEPADTAALRGRKRHAKTGKADSRHLRSHLAAGDLPECWIAPAHVLEARATVRLYKDLLDERGGWHQRIAATLFCQGVPAGPGMCTAQGRAAVAGMDLSPAGRQAAGTGLRQTGRLTSELDPLRRQLDMISRRQPGCRALRATQYGIGPVTAVAIWAELGDVRRFASSDDVIRHTGLDITVYSSGGKRPAGHLSRQGPQLLRWALYESAKCAARPSAPDHGYYTAARDRRNAGLATLPAARKLARPLDPVPSAPKPAAIRKRARTNHASPLTAPCLTDKREGQRAQQSGDAERRPPRSLQVNATPGDMGLRQATGRS